MLEESYSDCLSSFDIADHKLVKLCSNLGGNEHAGGSDCDVCKLETCNRRNWVYLLESEYLYTRFISYFWFRACECRQCLLYRLLISLTICKTRTGAGWQTRIINALFKINIDCKLIQIMCFVATTLRRKWLFAALDCKCALTAIAALNRAVACELEIKYYKRLIVSSSRWLTAWILKTCFQHSLNKPDIARAGKLGLLISVNRFDFYSGFKFSTYARWWVKHRMFKVSMLSVTIQMPKASVFRIRSASTDYSASHAVSVYKSDCFRLVSLDQTIGDDCDLHSVTAYSGAAGGIERYKGIVWAFKILKKLVLLAPKEERVLRLRGQLITGYGRSLTRIGNELGLSRERVRQIELRASAKVRALNDAVVQKYY
ncbi:MAG: sigma factor-like helix-turn-helix DNA-binding protein [Candidatus Hodgkinia cicadicola]